MDRFVRREPRATADPQGNQLIRFTPTPGSSSMVPQENMYYTGNYGAEFPNMQRMVSFPYIPVNHVINTPADYQQSNPGSIQAQGKMMSGIDPRYLAGYTDNKAQYIVADNVQGITGNLQRLTENTQYIPGNTQAIAGNLQLSRGYVQEIPGNQQAIPGNQQAIPGNQPAVPGNQQAVPGNQPAVPGNQQAVPGNQQAIPGNQHAVPRNVKDFSKYMQAQPTGFGADYQNRNFIGLERNIRKSFTPQASSPYGTRRQQETYKGSIYNPPTPSDSQDAQSITRGPNRNFKKPVDVTKNETQNNNDERVNKIKAINKTGPRVFSGSVENVLKWHKSLQNTGKILIYYEIIAAVIITNMPLKNRLNVGITAVAAECVCTEKSWNTPTPSKCVSVNPGESCAKNLVVRDDNGPAMQVVYYEIDFLLPDFKLPCTVRVIGRMMPGTSRFHAFNVRLATGDDVMMLSRRAPVAAYHVTELCKAFENNVQ